MNSQKASSLLLKSNSLKLNKIAQNIQNKELQSQIQLFNAEQKQKIHLIEQGILSLEDKLNDLKTNYQLRSKKMTEIIKDDKQAMEQKLSVMKPGKINQLKYQYKHVMECLYKEMEELHYKNMQEIQSDCKTVEVITKQIRRQQEQMNVIRQVYRAQTHKILDEVLLNQKNQLEQLNHLEISKLEEYNKIQENYLEEIRNWSKKAKDKRAKITKGLGRILDNIDF